MSEIILCGEHNAWKLFKKDMYTGKGQKEIEEMYDFMHEVKSDLGDDKLKRLFNYWDELSSETFFVLINMVYANKYI